MLNFTQYNFILVIIKFPLYIKILYMYIKYSQLIYNNYAQAKLITRISIRYMKAGKTIKTYNSWLDKY